jgi:hypothetical protein
MSVCSLSIAIELADYVEITHLFEVIRRYIITTPYDYSDLKLLLGFLANVKLFVEFYHIKRHQIQPESNIALT